MVYYVYKMIHTPTGRVYIGQRKLPKGKTPETDCYYGSGKVWKRIYKQHPEECVKVILEVVKTKKEVDELEKKFITHYRSVYGGLCVNISDGGQGGSAKGEKCYFFGKHHSEETRMKISEALKGRQHSEEHRRKNSEAHKGKTAWNKGKKCPQLSEMQLGEKNHMFGKHHSEEHKQKIAESMIGEKNHFFGKHHSAETRRKISEAKKGKHRSEEDNRKISEALKNRKDNA